MRWPALTVFFVENEARSTELKLKIAEEKLAASSNTLQRLQAQDISFTYGYFSSQWERQRECQLVAMEEGGVQGRLEKNLIALLDMEEEVKEAQKGRANRNEEEMEKFMSLPASIVAMDNAIVDIAEELGSPEFRDLQRATDKKKKALIRVRLAKMKLYEAKGGIVEAQKKWDKEGQGTKAQQGMKTLMNKKQLLFRRKWTSYQYQVTAYNNTQPFSNMPCPTQEETRRLPFEDVFWNMGAFSHPTELWAVDAGTIEGIQAFLLHRSCSEELRRIGRETQQMVLHALKTEEKLDGLLALCNTDYNYEDGGRQIIELVQPGQRISKDTWEVSVAVLREVHDNLRQKHCRTWMTWNTSVGQLLQKTYQHTTSTAEQIDSLIRRWDDLLFRSKSIWECIVNAENIEATALDELEIFEKDMLHAEGDIGQLGQLVDNMYIIDENDEEDEDLGDSGMNAMMD
ncbi:hypothetical protein DFH28DRAFT_1086996 [Melampsora americana]|nr:hypothetical protein DFH28DRAFT_1086996 [Melampsora americana]